MKEKQTREGWDEQFKKANMIEDHSNNEIEKLLPMSWNYRIMKRKHPTGEILFGIYEVYYDKNSKIRSWSENAMTGECETIDDLKGDLEYLSKAFDKEILEYKD